MKFNQYTWNLYKQSSDGQKAIKEFEEPSNNDTMMDLVFKYNPRMKLWFNDDKSRLSISNISESLWCYNICEFPDEERPNTSHSLFYKMFCELFQISGLYCQSNIGTTI